MRAILVLLAALTAPFIRAQLGMVPQAPNSPFSAEIVSTQVQTLADGTHITEPERTTRIYRDSFGRSRSESSILPPSRASSASVSRPRVDILIIDPVEGVEYYLDTDRKIARKTVLPKRAPPQTLSPEVQRALVALPRDGPPMAIRVTPAGTEVVSAEGLPFAANRLPGAPQSKTEALGKQTIEGVIAEGHRTTTTYAVGAFGNDRELITSNETWMSPELGMLVLTKTIDPRTGERTTRVTNLSRSEPDSSLFQPPSDYKIEEPPQGAK